MIITLNIICTTFARGNIHKRLLKSILNDSFNPLNLKINFILIDQNKRDAYFENKKYGKINLEIIGSSQIGISSSRNIGLKRVKKGYVWFLDDDCIVPKGTFNKIIYYLNQNKHGFSFVAENFENKPFRVWPKKKHSYNFLSTWYLSFTINSIFPYKKGMFCDLDLGQPLKYGSCEDLDFSIRYFKKLVFIPEILIIHKDIKKSMIFEKIFKYASGFGYVCRKHMPIGLAILFFSCLVIAKHLIDDFDLRRFYYALKGRLLGIFRLC